VCERRPQGLAGLGEFANVIARGIRIPNMSLYNVGWFPAVVKDKEGPGVDVEIVEVPVSILRVVDGYEGCYPDDKGLSLFVREAVDLPNGDTVLIYLYNRPLDVTAGMELVPSGRWEDVPPPPFKSRNPNFIH
jgi:gamma-glutamylcyclotransferase (GGCT)/AIG2-like uncharacterized protein YtfP